MAITAVSQIFANVRLLLQDLAEPGSGLVQRWSDEQLLAWLNEAYQALVSMKSGAAAVVRSWPLQTGSRQTLPDDCQRLLDVVRNLALQSDGAGISVANRFDLEAVDPDWHRGDQSLDIEHYSFDERDPRSFMVYPAAADGAEVEIVYDAIPAPHVDLATALTETIRVDDAYAPALVDYILYRCFDQDADFAGNMQRSSKHFQAFTALLGQRIKLDTATSPNSQARLVNTQ